MPHTTRMLIFLVALCAATLPARAQDAVDLRPQFTQGQSAAYHFWSERVTDLTIEAGGEQESITSTLTFEGEAEWTVTAVRADGSATCELNYRWLTIDAVAPDGTVAENDSRRGSGDMEPIHDLLKALVDQTLRYEISVDGDVTSLDGPAGVRAKLDDADMAPEEREFTVVAEELAFLTEAPALAALGDDWEHRYDLPHEMGEMSYRVRYQLDEITTIENVPVARLSTSARLDFEPDLSDIPDGVDVQTRLAVAESDGMILYDLDRNEAVGRHGAQRTVIEVIARFPGQTFSQTIEERRAEQVLRIEELD